MGKVDVFLIFTNQVSKQGPAVAGRTFTCGLFYFILKRMSFSVVRFSFFWIFVFCERKNCSFELPTELNRFNEKSIWENRNKAHKNELGENVSVNLLY